MWLTHNTSFSHGYFGETFTAVINRQGEPQMKVVCKVGKEGAGRDEWQEMLILVSCLSVEYRNLSAMA